MMPPFNKRRAKSGVGNRAMPAPSPAMAAANNTVKVHDEADVFSFRASVSERFKRNHELLENVTSKFVPIQSIIPPSSFPVDDEAEGESYMLGDLDAMKDKLKSLEAEYEILSKDDIDNASEALLGEEFRFQREKAGLLQRAFQNLTSSLNYENQRKLTQEILKEYPLLYGKKIVEREKVRIFSRPNLDESKTSYELAEGELENGQFKQHAQKNEVEQDNRQEPDQNQDLFSETFFGEPEDVLMNTGFNPPNMGAQGFFDELDGL